MGKIAHDVLQSKFAQDITLEAIVERNSAAITARKAVIEAELERLGRQASYAQEMMSAFEQIDHAHAIIRSLESNVTRLSHNRERAAVQLQVQKLQLTKLATERDSLARAGALRRVFMRSLGSIEADRRTTLRRISDADSALEEAGRQVLAEQQAIASASAEMELLITSVAGVKREAIQQILADYERLVQPLRQELGVIAQQLETIKASVLIEAKIVGSTITRTYLRPDDFTSFDAVIVDEASMILLPGVFHAAGLASESVMIAGDFRQLSPIVSTKEQAIHDVLGHDVFVEGGIDHAATCTGVSNLVCLELQYRMDEAICKLVSNTFYGGRLSTASSSSERLQVPPPFDGRLMIIDTSRVWPFTTRDTCKSRLNLMHALAVRNLLLHLQEASLLEDAENVGVCTPYRAQAELYRAILQRRRISNVALPRLTASKGTNVE